MDTYLGRHKETGIIWAVTDLVQLLQKLLGQDIVCGIGGIEIQGLAVGSNHSGYIVGALHATLDFQAIHTDLH
jgi:hypothetical protein